MSLGFPLREKKGVEIAGNERLGQLQEPSCFGEVVLMEVGIVVLLLLLLEQSGAGGFPWSSSVSQNLPSARLCKLCFWKRISPGGKGRLFLYLLAVLEPDSFLEQFFAFPSLR